MTTVGFKNNVITDGTFITLGFKMLLRMGLLLRLGPNVITAGTFITLGSSYYTCAFNRCCRDLSSAEFQRALKEFIARRGCPQILVSDNGITFVATGKWLSNVGALNIRWRFNLARDP